MTEERLERIRQVIRTELERQASERDNRAAGQATAFPPLGWLNVEALARAIDAAINGSTHATAESLEPDALNSTNDV